MIRKRIELHKLTTIHLAGWVDLNIIENMDDMNEIHGYVIGGGSNLLIKHRDAKLYKLSNNFSYIKITKNVLVCGGALPISKLMGFLIKNSISSLEFLAGIPATIGGAVFMNAGAFGSFMFDKILYVKAFSNKTGIINLKRDELDFGYRRSNLSKFTVIEAGFKYYDENKKRIENKIKNNIQKRINTAHLRNTFGSVFKNPNNDYAGRLLEESGLKGLKKNSAHISEKHANYILGSSRTDVNDVLFLINEAKDRVFKNFSIELEKEVEII